MACLEGRLEGVEVGEVKDRTNRVHLATVVEVAVVVVLVDQIDH